MKYAGCMRMAPMVPPANNSLQFIGKASAQEDRPLARCDFSSPREETR